MKHISFIAIFLFALGAVCMVSCQKDTDNVSLVDASANTFIANTEGVTERGPLILATSVTTYCTCKQGRTCGIWAYTNTKRNAIKVTLNAVTHNYYNASGPGLTYTIKNSSNSVVASFTCNQAVVEYSNSNLLNNGLYTVTISSGPSSSPLYSITVGSCNGQSCNNDPN